MMGARYAKVLPLPVSAARTAFLPLKIGSLARACMHTASASFYAVCSTIAEGLQQIQSRQSNEAVVQHLDLGWPTVSCALQGLDNGMSKTQTLKPAGSQEVLSRRQLQL